MNTKMKTNNINLLVGIVVNFLIFSAMIYCTYKYCIELIENNTYSLIIYGVIVTAIVIITVYTKTLYTLSKNDSINTTGWFGLLFVVGGMTLCVHTNSLSEPCIAISMAGGMLILMSCMELLSKGIKQIKE